MSTSLRALPRPPYPMPPTLVCQFCGHPAKSFWPGRYVDHGGRVLCTRTAVRQVQRLPRARRTGAAA
ncbi:hypothetical protein [Amycolatopsis minnesotensis]|uniref:Uncharacterized protein n=1 Tax=Amycolatopsis minnesotensis TaxID=337894 RepID=A0ABN2R1Q0_9PSEU